MTKKKINWQLHETPGMFAYRAELGNRGAEIIRAYEGQWFVCAYLDGRLCKLPKGDTTYEPYNEAKTRAEQFLRGGGDQRRTPRSTDPPGSQVDSLISSLSRGA